MNILTLLPVSLVLASKRALDDRSAREVGDSSTPEADQSPLVGSVPLPVEILDKARQDVNDRLHEWMHATRRGAGLSRLPPWAGPAPNDRIDVDSPPASLMPHELLYLPANIHTAFTEAEEAFQYLCHVASRSSQRVVAIFSPDGLQDMADLPLLCPDLSSVPSRQVTSGEQAFAFHARPVALAVEPATPESLAFDPRALNISVETDAYGSQSVVLDVTNDFPLAVVSIKLVNIMSTMLSAFDGHDGMEDKMSEWRQQCALLVIWMANRPVTRKITALWSLASSLNSRFAFADDATAMTLHLLMHAVHAHTRRVHSRAIHPALRTLPSLIASPSSSSSSSSSSIASSSPSSSSAFPSSSSSYSAFHSSSSSSSSAASPSPQWDKLKWKELNDTIRHATSRLSAFAKSIKAVHHHFRCDQPVRNWSYTTNRKLVRAMRSLPQPLRWLRDIETALLCGWFDHLWAHRESQHDLSELNDMLTDLATFLPDDVLFDGGAFVLRRLLALYRPASVFFVVKIPPMQQQRHRLATYLLAILKVQFQPNFLRDHDSYISKLYTTLQEGYCPVDFDWRFWGPSEFGSTNIDGLVRALNGFSTGTKDEPLCKLEKQTLRPFKADSDDVWTFCREQRAALMAAFQNELRYTAHVAPMSRALNDLVAAQPHHLAALYVVFGELMHDFYLQPHNYHDDLSASVCLSARLCSLSYFASHVRRYLDTFSRKGPASSPSPVYYSWSLLSNCCSHNEQSIRSWLRLQELGRVVSFDDDSDFDAERLRRLAPSLPLGPILPVDDSPIDPSWLLLFVLRLSE